MQEIHINYNVFPENPNEVFLCYLAPMNYHFKKKISIFYTIISIVGNYL